MVHMLEDYDKRALMCQLFLISIVTGFLRSNFSSVKMNFGLIKVLNDCIYKKYVFILLGELRAIGTVLILAPPFVSILAIIPRD